MEAFSEKDLNVKECHTVKFSESTICGAYKKRRRNVFNVGSEVGKDSTDDIEK